MPRIDEETIRALPKAEVHVHLEGAFELVDLIDLAKTAGVALPGPARSLFDIGTHEAPPEGEAGGIGGGGLSGFLRFLDWQCSLVTTAEQAARAAYRFAARESASGVRYADVIVNPAHWSAWRGRTPQLLAALAAGLDEAAQDGLAEVGLCVSVLRSQTSLEALELVDWMASARPDRVVALSVDGDERVSGRTGEKFAPAFAAAAAAGFHRTVHAGESSGPEGVWDALELLLAERVDHGVRAVDDPALLARLVDDGVPLGVCPRSNVLLGVYPDWESHPVQRLRDAGVTVTVNTDDPAPLGTRLEFEWSMCADTFGWSLADLRGIAHNSITASFAHDDLKRDLHAEIDAFEADDAAGAPEDAAG